MKNDSEAQAVLGRLASELAQISDEIAHLEDAVSELIGRLQSERVERAETSAELLVDLQSLDRLRQSTGDLGRFLKHMTEDKAFSGKSWEEKIAGFALRDLGERIVGVGESSSTYKLRASGEDLTLF